jgi:hypothetical protein
VKRENLYLKEVIRVRTRLAIGIGVVVAVLVIVFCILPLKEVSYEGIEKYQAPQTYYTEEPYTELIPYPAQGWQSAELPARYLEFHEVEKAGSWATQLWESRQHIPVRYKTAGYREVTLYQDVAKQTYVWQERTVTLYKKVSFLEAAIAY